MGCLQASDSIDKDSSSIANDPMARSFSQITPQELMAVHRSSVTLETFLSTLSSRPRAALTIQQPKEKETEIPKNNQPLVTVFEADQVQP